jgi:hypothetical protein
MNSIRRFSIATIALAAALPAFGQNDTAFPISTGNGVPATPPVVVSGSGGNKTNVLFDNGSNIVTHPGAGFGGNDASMIEPGYNTFGFADGGAGGFRIADDFTVTGGPWTLTNLRWLGYQTGAATTGTLTGININFWAADPFLGGAASQVGPANSLTSVSFAGIYRVQSGQLTNNQRAVFRVNGNLAWAAPIANGPEWIDVMLTGTLASGPWAPPTVPAAPATDNGSQFVPPNWAKVQDGLALVPQDFPFVLEGNRSGGPVSYCTQAKATSVPSCVPALTASNTSLATGSWNVSNVPLGPGVTATVGIYIYTDGVGIGQSAFSQVIPFGTLCLQGFKRSSPACSASVFSGTQNTCVGTFSTAVNCNAGALGIAVGEDVNVQCWYRDPPNVANANFTNAIFYTVN